MSDLRIFELGIKLAQLLNGDKEAIADIKKLYERHPEMFKNVDDVAQVIKDVVREPKVAINANREHRKGIVIKAINPLNEKKMGDVIISREQDTNVIFHTNKKKISEFTRIFKKLDPKDNLIDGEDAQPSHPAENQQVGATGTKELKPSVRSSINGNNYTTNLSQSQVFDPNDSSALDTLIKQSENSGMKNLNKTEISQEISNKTKWRKQ